MSYAKKLQEKRSALVEKAEAIVALATTEERDLTTQEDADVASALSEATSLDDSIQHHEQLEARSAEAAQLREVRGITEKSVSVVKSEPRTYHAKSEVSFLADAYASQFNNDYQAKERLSRHMQEESVERRAVTSANFTGLVVPQYLTDLVAPVRRAGRPLADVANHMTLPDSGLTLSISRVTTGSSTAVQTEGSAVSETNMDDTQLDVTVKTIGGQQTVSRQAIERGTGVDGIVMRDLVASYNTVLDGLLTADLLANSGQSVSYTDASPTVGELYPKLLDAVQKVQTTYFGGPNLIVMHPRRLAFFMAALDSQNRPLVVPAPVAMNPIGSGDGMPIYGNSGYSIAGIPILTDANVTTANGAGTNEDAIFVTNTNEIHLWEQANQPLMLRFDQPNAASLNILVVVYGYIAHTVSRYANAHAKITGTGLVTPTF